MFFWHLEKLHKLCYPIVWRARKKISFTWFGFAHKGSKCQWMWRLVGPFWAAIRKIETFFKRQMQLVMLRVIFKFLWHWTIFYNPKFAFVAFCSQVCFFFVPLETGRGVPCMVWEAGAQAYGVEMHSSVPLHVGFPTVYLKFLDWPVLSFFPSKFHRQKLPHCFTVHGSQLVAS